MPEMSLEPPALKMSSLVVLMASLTKSTARAPLALVVVPWKSLKTWFQSCEPLTSTVVLPSSSKRLGGRPSGRVELGLFPKKVRGTRALTVIDSVAPPAREALVADSTSLLLIEAVSNWEETTDQASCLLASS